MAAGWLTPSPVGIPGCLRLEAQGIDTQIPVMIRSIMSNKPILHLCDPVDPSEPLVIYSHYHPRLHKTFQLRTLSLPGDMSWYLQWIGREGVASHHNYQMLKASLLQSLHEEACSEYSQPLVAMEDEVPRLFMSVIMESQPYVQITGTKHNYVFFPFVDQRTPVIAALEATRQALNGIFQFAGIERVFCYLDGNQLWLEPLFLAAGFQYLESLAFHARGGSRHYCANKYLGV